MSWGNVRDDTASPIDVCLETTFGIWYLDYSLQKSCKVQEFPLAKRQCILLVSFAKMWLATGSEYMPQ